METCLCIDPTVNGIVAATQFFVIASNGTGHGKHSHLTQQGMELKFMIRYHRRLFCSSSSQIDTSC